MAPDTNIFDKIQSLLGEVTADEAIRRVEEIELKIEELRDEQSKWRSIYGLKQQLGEPSSTAVNASSPVRPADTRSGFHRNVGPLTYAILDYIRSYGESAVKLSDVTDEMKRRELVPSDARGSKRVSVTAARLVDRRQLERVGKGFYKLPPEGSRPEEEDREMTLDVATG